jgi:hypothetical protein
MPMWPQIFGQSKVGVRGPVLVGSESDKRETCVKNKRCACYNKAMHGHGKFNCSCHIERKQMIEQEVRSVQDQSERKTDAEVKQ